MRRNGGAVVVAVAPDEMRSASGKCCGVAQNAYHTLRSMTFLLPSGTEIDTDAPHADALFREREPRLAAGLLELKRQLEASRTCEIGMTRATGKVYRASRP